MFRGRSSGSTLDRLFCLFFVYCIGRAVSNGANLHGRRVILWRVLETGGFPKNMSGLNVLFSYIVAVFTRKAANLSLLKVSIEVAQ